MEANTAPRLPPRGIELVRFIDATQCGSGSPIRYPPGDNELGGESGSGCPPAYPFQPQLKGEGQPLMPNSLFHRPGVAGHPQPPA
jgi:hypothetical protein